MFLREEICVPEMFVPVSRLVNLTAASHLDTTAYRSRIQGAVYLLTLPHHSDFTAHHLVVRSSGMLTD